MPPTLDLRQECLTATIRPDLAIVEAMMLWPDNEAARERWLNSVATLEAASLGDGLPESLRLGALNLAAQTTPISELQKIAGDRRNHGCIAGAILRLAVREALLGDGAVKKGIILTQLVEQLRPINRRHGVRLEEKTINNVIWPQYRSVAHFWAAHTVLVESGRNAFPCAIGDLAEFLAWAKEFQKAGEAAQTKQGPVLRPGESVCVPGFLALPTAVLEFVGKTSA